MTASMTGTLNTATHRKYRLCLLAFIVSAPKANNFDPSPGLEMLAFGTSAGGGGAEQDSVGLCAASRAGP